MRHSGASAISLGPGSLAVHALPRWPASRVWREVEAEAAVCARRGVGGVRVDHADLDRFRAVDAAARSEKVCWTLLPHSSQSSGRSCIGASGIADRAARACDIDSLDEAPINRAGLFVAAAEARRIDVDRLRKLLLGGGGEADG
jgi:hypothetical protein